MDETTGIIISVLAAIVVAFLIIITFSWGDGTQYDVINPTSQYIDSNGGYHFRGILDTSNCGTATDHVFRMRPYTFTVDKELFYESFNLRTMRVVYDCKDGMVTNVRWGV